MMLSDCLPKAGHIAVFKRVFPLIFATVATKIIRKCAVITFLPKKTEVSETVTEAVWLQAR